jgi:hypothetical protein
MIDFQVRKQTGEQPPEIIAEGTREAMAIIRKETKEQFKDNPEVRVWMTPSPRNGNRGTSIKIECENRTSAGINIIGFGISSLEACGAGSGTSHRKEIMQ